jgi:pimeloyl-ACP methyl ester carboxylesterase
MTFILVPGAGGDSWYWHRVVPMLTAAGRRAIAVDLPASDDSAGLAEYAEVIERAAASQVDIILVAQSLGGFSAPLVAARRHVRELVLVNAMIPAPGETGGAWWVNTDQRAARSAKAERDGRVLGDDFDVVAEFFHDVPDEVIAEAFLRGEPQQSDRPFADPWPLESWPDVPTRLVAGADDRFFPVEFQRRVAAERLGLDVDVLPGGHCIALSQPAALTSYLLAA